MKPCHYLFCLIALPGLALAQEASTSSPPRDNKPVELPGASVIGNQELPVGLDIVPWRPSSAGEVKDGPTQLLDAPLQPIDPEVFRRELSIYEANKP